MKKTVLALTLVLASGLAYAGPLKGHGNLKEAHNKIKMAIAAMERAQKANHYDMEGHAAKAEALLRQAEQEIAQAGEAATENKK
jgi:hypothetical protein